MSPAIEDKDLTAGKVATRVPGETGVWVLVLGDLSLFTAFFVNYLNDRGHNYTEFVAAQAKVNQVYGLVNTIILLCSSWLVIAAVQSARSERVKRASNLLFGAAALGVVFLVLKILEYSEKITVGIVPNTNLFYNHYFFLTGLHFVHVVLGVALLLLMSQYGRFNAPVESKLRNLESGASFWHLVDLLWIALFALLYLLP
ncbi:MAG: cytochrome c oxidase subunit 3 [Halieaceae bacterium]|nr:cytochrome c oxidase subunit 3 [Halieaceae bacterium]